MAMELPIRRRCIGVAVALLGMGALLPGVSSAQVLQPVFECVDSGALRVTCRGAFLDGSSAAGITVRVFDKANQLVYVGTVDRQGRFTFRKPDEEFHIVFDAGRGKVMTVLAAEVT